MLLPPFPLFKISTPSSQEQPAAQPTTSVHPRFKMPPGGSYGLLRLDGEGRPSAPIPLPAERNVLGREGGCPVTVPLTAAGSATTVAKGLELKSDWLTSPPTVDPHFLSKLETEKRKGFLVTRVKVDPFHWLKRYSDKALSKSHILFSLFMGCMRDAVFHLHQPDAEAYKVHLVATGRTTKVL